MRLLLSAIVALALGSVANANLITTLPDVPLPGTNYELTISTPVVLGQLPGSGNDVLGVTLTATNVSGSDDFDINTLLDMTIGSNGSLHHEQAPSPVPVFNFVTPLASSFTDSTAPVSAVDSHFLNNAELSLPGGDPTETNFTDASGVPATALEPLFGAAAATGFGGVLTGSYSLSAADTGPVVDIAYLVFEDLGVDTEVDFAVTVGNAVGQPETFAAAIVGIPEPSTVLLASLAAVGFATRRRV